jgi:hypothetical protein
MKKLVIGTVAAVSLLAPAATSTVLLAQSSPESQALRAAGDVNMDATPSLSPDIIRRVQLALQKKGINLVLLTESSDLSQKKPSAAFKTATASRRVATSTTRRCSRWAR